MSKLKDIRNTNPVTIDLNGKEYTMKYDLNAFAELESRFGNIQKAMQEMESGSMKSIRTILWAGLIHAEAVIDKVTGEPTGYDITPFQVGSWISADMLPIVSERIALAMGADIPDIEKIPEVNSTTKVVDSSVVVAKVVPTEEEKREEEKKA